MGTLIPSDSRRVCTSRVLIHRSFLLPGLLRDCFRGFVSVRPRLCIMSSRTSVAVIGVGLIGSTLLTQLQEQQIKASKVNLVGSSRSLRVVAAATSSHMLLSDFFSKVIGCPPCNVSENL